MNGIISLAGHLNCGRLRCSGIGLVLNTSKAGLT